MKDEELKVEEIEVSHTLICECQCDERLKGKVEVSTRLAYTG